MADFSSYNGVSDEWEAFSATLPKVPFPPPSETTAGLVANQTATNSAVAAMGTPMMATLAPQLLIKDHNIPARPGSSHIIPGRSYQPLAAAYKDTKTPCYIHFHGGGFMYGSLATEDATCARFALEANILVLSVDYRHAPVHTYPAAWEDAEDAVAWVVDGAGAEVLGIDRDRVVVGGPSAGGWLTASTVLGRKLQGKRNVAGQILMIPGLVNMHCYEPVLKRLKDEEDSSMKVNADVEEFGVKHLKFFTELIRFPETTEETSKDLRMNPGMATAEDVKGLPPTIVGCAGRDPLRDEGLLYGKTLAEAGVPTDIHVFTGVPHTFRVYVDDTSEGRRSEKLMVDGLSWMLSKPAPSNKFEVKVR